MLDMTPKEVKERQALRINPCKTCQPVGAMYCALGVHRCMPLSHGSQGCCSYHRTVLSRHFKEPAIAGSSSFTEGTSVFGGRSNVTTATKNIFDIYNPDIIAIHTTCLSETIGDDLASYIMDMDLPEGKRVIHCNTPSYVGSHIYGFANQMKGFIDQLTEKTGTTNGKTAIFPGWVDPGDLREMKRIAEMMNVPIIMFPDQSGVMDAPMTGRYEIFPEGGTTIDEIQSLGDSQNLIALGEVINQEPAEMLKKRWQVPFELLPMPVGVSNTDKYVMALKKISNAEVPPELEAERGRLMDFLLDSNQYTNRKKVAIFGDPDVVIGLTSLCLEAGMLPKYVITGTPKEMFTKRVTALFEAYDVQEECKAKANADLFELHQWIKNEKVDLLLGSTYGKQIAKAEDIPFVRAGFPVMDRYGGTIQPIVGYAGAIRMLEKITEAIMTRMERDMHDEDFEIVM
ncbi:nitrogenase component 1 [Sporolactobacillus terrae]|uniref:Nitrogenase molybdenum-iron protein subunit beta n=1 Tax=Sporolactobacillus terrae TaxID=269673 RepID=A0A5K7X1T0_9BACL|nr:nitrogenase component 1 [Sporolactobacillus terrae]BBN99979.1 nitrogenase molybdenum-iron protein subunit beta [Sporolactobacillus terrae]